jgi:hypothetical protein
MKFAGWDAAVGQVWLIDMASIEAYLALEIVLLTSVLVPSKFRI